MNKKNIVRVGSPLIKLSGSAHGLATVAEAIQNFFFKCHHNAITILIYHCNADTILFYQTKMLG